MAPRKKGKQRLHGVLRVYRRPMRGGALWWWCARGRERHALGLEVAAVPYEEAHRVACERHGAGQLARPDAGGEATLRAVVVAYAAEQGARYKPRTWRSKEYLLNAFVHWMELRGAARPSQVTDALLAKWVDARRRGDPDTVPPRGGGRRPTRKPTAAQNATINRALVVARVCLRWAARRVPPLCKPTALERAADLREVGRTAHAVIPSPDEWRRVVSLLASEPRPARCGAEETALARRHDANARGAALLVACGVETGLRIDELRHVRAVDVEDGAVHVRAFEGWAPKSWEERKVPIARQTADSLRAFVAWRDRAVGLNGKPVVLGDHWVNGRLDAAWSRGGSPGEAPRMHDARRTFATEHVRRGLGIDRVRVLLGHKDVSTTERYVGRYRSDAEEPVSALGVASVLGAPAADVIPMAGRTRR